MIAHRTSGHGVGVQLRVVRIVSGLFALGVGLTLASSACSSPVALGGFVDAGDVAPPLPEAGSSEVDANEFRPLCKAADCPAPYTTCSDDAFGCETNVDIDNANCGACGVVCPNGPEVKDVFGAEWFCQSGECRMACDPQGHLADCNGQVADGCETDLRCDADNCGACGVECPSGLLCIRGNCGCPAGLTACGEACNADCVDLRSDDFHCGTCGNECPFSFDPPFPPPGMRRGCGDSKCGALKCEGGFADCNNDTNSPDTDGCEVSLADDAQNCGACGKACAPGQFCENGKCECGPKETACPGFGTTVTCADLDSDPRNCGVCGNACPNVFDGSGKAVCRLGHCEIECKGGYADCDGRVDNGCETHVAADPRNCGACGAHCDLSFGQPCVAGACRMAPCDPGEAR